MADLPPARMTVLQFSEVIEQPTGTSPRSPSLFPDLLLPKAEEPRLGATILDLPGCEVRQRLKGTLAELRVQNPDIQSEAVFSAAFREIPSLSLEQAGRLGVEEQQDVSRYSEELLLLTSDPDLQAIRQTLQAVQEQMERTAYLSPLAAKPSWFVFPRLATTPSEQRAQILQRLQEIQSRSAQLSERSERLSRLAAGLPSFLERLQRGQERIETCLVLTRLVRGSMSDPALLERRIESLLLTRLTLQQEQAHLELFQQQLETFLLTIREVLLNAIPAWCTASAGALTQVGTATEQRVYGEQTAHLRTRITELLAVWKGQNHACV